MNRNGGQGKTYLINDVSRRVGLSQKRIREYETARFIKPARAPRTNNRLYAEFDIRIIERVKELIHQHGFTVACLRYFLSSAPCWTIYNCRNKESCQAYQSPHSPCYEVVKGDRRPIKDRCLSCPVYLNKDLQRIALLEKDLGS